MTLNIISHHKPHRRKTMFNLIAKIVCIELVLVGLGFHLIHSLPTKCIDTCIEPFNDLILPIEGDKLVGAPGIEGLGRVIPVPADNGKGDKFWPSKPNTIKTKFDIITRRGQVEKLEFEHKQRPVEQLGLELCDINHKYPFNFTKLTEAQFDANRRTVIVIGGYLTLEEYEWFPISLIDRWLSMQDLNIIVVTWKSSNQGSFENAVANIPYVARQISILLYYLARMSNLELDSDLGRDFLDKIHIIGHSCGAHISGFVGKDLGGLIGRISGFDPAGPHFDEFAPKYRLDKVDSKLVDVYHSNAGKLDKKTVLCSMMLDKTGGKNWMCPASNVGVDADPLKPGAWFGINKPIGHIDVYLNNGHKQPGCYDRAHICDHGRAHNLIGDFILNTAEMLTLPSSSTPRPLAFRAPDYSSYQNGETFRQAKGCSWITNDLHNDRQSGELGSCSIGINFIKSPREYRRELELLNGIDLSSTSEESRQYYLATLGNNPILPMHHFLLKLKLAKPQNGETLERQWIEECRLDVDVSFSNPKDKISMHNLRIDLDNLDQMVLALPFHHPRGLDIVMNNELEKFFENVQHSGWIEENKLDLRGELFPRKLQISSWLADSFGKAARKLPGPTKFKTTSDNKFASCQLDFSYAIIEPVWSNTKTFYGQFVLTEKHNARSNDSLYVTQLSPWSKWGVQYDTMHISMSDEPIDLGLKTIIIDE